MKTNPKYTTIFFLYQSVLNNYQYSFWIYTLDIDITSSNIGILIQLHYPNSSFKVAIGNFNLTSDICPQKIP